MITPEEAIFLKAAEVKWLRAGEKHVDQQLREHFVGEAVTIEFHSWPPHRRTADILIGRYQKNRWTVRQLGTGYSYQFSSSVTVIQPPFPTEKDPEPPVETTGHRATTWDRIAAETIPDDEVDISVVEDTVPE